MPCQSTQESYLALAQDWELWHVPLSSAVQRLTQRVSETLNAARVSLWLLEEGDDILRCLDLYDRSEDGHGAGGVLARPSFPRYFHALEQGRVIDVSDVLKDARTQELYEPYLQSNDVGALLDATLRVGGVTRGVLCIEHVGAPRLWRDDEQRFVVSVADLAAQILIFDELRQRERSYRSLLNNMPSAAYRCRWDDGWHTEFVSGAIERLTGFPADHFKRGFGQCLWNFLEDEDKQPLREAMDASRTRMQPFEMNARLISRAGGSRWVKFQGRPVVDQQGRVRQIDGVIHDIAEELEAEQRLRTSEALLAEAQTVAHLGNWDLNLQTGEATWSDEEFRLLGFEPGGVPPGAESFMQAVHPEDRERVQQAMSRVMDSTTGDEYAVEHRVLLPSGEERVLQQTGRVSFDEAGRPLRMFGVTLDVTERARFEHALELSRKTLLARNEHLRLINDLAARLHDTTDAQRVAEITIETLKDLKLVPHAGFHLLNETAQCLSLSASFGLDEEALKAGSCLTLDGSLSGLALREGRPLHTSDMSQDERADPRVRAALSKLGSTALLILPLIYNNQRLGSLSFVFPKGRAFDEDEREALEAVRWHVSLALANARTHATLLKQARQDALTGLSNRVALHERFVEMFDRTRLAGRKIALMLIDLDRFKDVNDTLGHDVGDHLLQQVAHRLLETQNSTGAVLTRLGGDEFAILLPDLADVGEAERVGRALLADLRNPIEVKGVRLEIGASLGIALAPDHGESSHDLLRMADIAMCDAKQSGAGLRLFNASLDTHTPERLALMGDLAQAIRGDELVLHYQPKIDLRFGAVTGFEALLRWQHPRLGLLYPDRFMELAEMSDLIHPLTDRVMELALAQLRGWCDAGRHFGISINLSARNLLDDRSVRVLRELIERYAVDPALIELELTETSLMHDPQHASELLHQLAALGVSISIDDFGTGYSSLGYLRRLPIRSLKIDRTFVRDMLPNQQDAIIVHSTIGLAHNLGLQVVAEGVEDGETLAMLMNLGCDFAQGYHVCRPMPVDGLEDWLEKTGQ